jgi:hypothetical protein
MNQIFQIKSIYNSYMNSKPKDTNNMLLEPLQAMIQLSLLGACPIGTKLAICENILYIQNPSIIQPISRWFNSDKKDDLYFLFQVIRRFIKWYNPLTSEKSPITIDLYKLIIAMSIIGLDKLISTYSSAENNSSIMQVINMYKNLLQTTYSVDVEKLFLEKGTHIDDIFETIVGAYSQEPELVQLIHNSLCLIQKETNESYVFKMIDGMNLMTSKQNHVIQTWIKEHLVY